MKTIEEAKKEIDNVVVILQHLQLQPTKNNVDILTGSYNSLTAVYGFLDGLGKEMESMKAQIDKLEKEKIATAIEGGEG